MKKLMIGLMLVLSNGALASAAEVKVCRDGQYLASIPTESLDFASGVFAQAAAQGLLKVASQSPERGGMLYAIELLVPNGVSAMKTIADKPGVIVECNSSLGF